MILLDSTVIEFVQVLCYVLMYNELTITDLKALVYVNRYFVWRLDLLRVVGLVIKLRLSHFDSGGKLNSSLEEWAFLDVKNNDTIKSMALVLLVEWIGTRIWYEQFIYEIRAAHIYSLMLVLGVQ